MNKLLFGLSILLALGPVTSFAAKNKIVVTPQACSVPENATLDQINLRMNLL